MADNVKWLTMFHVPNFSSPLIPVAFICSSKKKIFKPGVRRLWPARAWFPNVDPVRTSVYVCVFVCVSAPEAINN